MSEQNNVNNLLQLLQKLAVSDLRHPERLQDLPTAVRLLSRVIGEQQKAIEELKMRVEELGQTSSV